MPARVASGASACPTAYVQRQCTQWESVRRWTRARRKGGSAAGAAAKHYATRPEFKPPGGFKSVYSEMGACLLDKTELLVDIVYQMATCTTYESFRGSQCFRDTAGDFSKHLRMCCVGRQQRGGAESAADCLKLVLPCFFFVTTVSLS